MKTKYLIYWFALVAILLWLFIVDRFFLKIEVFPNDNSISKSKSKDDSTAWQDFLMKWDYEKAIEHFEKANKFGWTDKDKMYLVKSYLSFWSSFYKEQENADKAMEILAKMKDSFEKFYYIGYAYEITNQFDKAIENYELSFKQDLLTDIQKAIALNQIWHVMDLQQDLEAANDYYKQAEDLKTEIVWNLVNRWRYEFRKNNFELAKSYFEKAITKTDDTFIIAEMYYNLSNVYLKQNQSIDMVIDLANKWLNFNPNYAQNYLMLWMGYILKWWESMELAPWYLIKMTEMNPNSALAYKYLWVYYYIKDDFENAIQSFDKQLQNSLVDISLMESEKQRLRKEALYDLAKSHAFNNNAAKSSEYLSELLADWTAKEFYTALLIEFSSEESPFKSVSKDKGFQDQVRKAIQVYRK